MEHLHFIKPLIRDFYGLPGWLSAKESGCQCKRHKRQGFDPWVGKIPWRGKWQPTPVFLPGKSHGQKSLVGYSPWGRKELDTTERLSAHAHTHTHTHTRSCASLYSPSSKWFHDALCVAQQKKGTRNGCYPYNWHWQQLSHRTERTCENHHHSFATVSAISTQAPEQDNRTGSASRCNVDKSASQLLTLLMLMHFFKDWI